MGDSVDRKGAADGGGRTEDGAAKIVAYDDAARAGERVAGMEETAGGGGDAEEIEKAGADLGVADRGRAIVEAAEAPLIRSEGGEGVAVCAPVGGPGARNAGAHGQGRFSFGDGGDAVRGGVGEREKRGAGGGKEAAGGGDEEDERGEGGEAEGARARPDGEGGGEILAIEAHPKGVGESAAAPAAELGGGLWSVTAAEEGRAGVMEFGAPFGEPVRARAAGDDAGGEVDEEAALEKRVAAEAGEGDHRDFAPAWMWLSRGNRSTALASTAVPRRVRR